MSDILLAEAVRDHLLAHDLIELHPDRATLESPSYRALHPVTWLNPRYGITQPDLRASDNGQPKQTQTASIVLETGTPPAPYEEEIEERIVDIYLRSYKLPPGEAWMRQVRAVLGGMRGGQIGNLQILWSLVQRMPQPLGADKRSHDFVQSFRIAALTSAIAAGP